jgi:CCR4-NOT transcriptional complex subunit CAF120
MEEIYTGHLLRTFVSGGRAPVVTGNSRSNWNEPDTTLDKGRMEGWVRVRVMGTIEWKRLWLVLSAPVETQLAEKKRKSLFSFGSSDKHGAEQTTGAPGVASTKVAGSQETQVTSAMFYKEQPAKGKNARNANPNPNLPVLTITDVTQA